MSKPMGFKGPLMAEVFSELEKTLYEANKYCPNPDQFKEHIYNLEIEEKKFMNKVNNNLTGKCYESFNDMINDEPKAGEPVKMYTESSLEKIYLLGYIAGKQSHDKLLIDELSDGTVIEKFNNAKKLL